MRVGYAERARSAWLERNRPGCPGSLQARTIGSVTSLLGHGLMAKS